MSMIRTTFCSRCPTHCRNTLRVEQSDSIIQIPRCLCVTRMSASPTFLSGCGPAYMRTTLDADFSTRESDVHSGLVRLPCFIRVSEDLDGILLEVPYKLQRRTLSGNHNSEPWSPPQGNSLWAEGQKENVCRQPHGRAKTWELPKQQKKHTKENRCSHDTA